MSKFGFDDARGNCHWLALTASLIIAAGTIIATMLWPDASDASIAPIESDPLAVAGDYPSPEHCRDCHPKEYEAWSGTSHAGAVFDPIFQVDLQKSDRPGECYACHTTGYDSETGQFALAGVTCEACHGPYQQGHSEQNVKVVFSGDLCGKCHTDILDQWLTSQHGQENMDCTACHEVHSQKTPAADETNSVCSSCHLDQIQSTLHTIHNASGIYCLDCHQGRADSVGVPPRGKADFVHVFSNFVRECDDCHAARPQPDL
jgi:hypothetical protein